MAQSPELANQAIRHQVYIERLKGSQVRIFDRFLRDIDRTVRDQLTRNQLTDFSRARLEGLLASVQRQLLDIYQSFANELQGELFELADYEADFEARGITRILAATAAAAPQADQVISAVMSKPLSVRGIDGGKLLDRFIADLGPTETQRVTGSIRRGFFEGRTSAQMIQEIRGTKANGLRDGLLQVSSRNAEAIVRTAVQHTASQARLATWEANPDIVKGYRWVATLDSRTTPVCRSLDGQVFKFGKGPVPPAHIRCRSTTVAELDERFGIKTEFRASQFGETRDQDYYSWLKTQSADFQDDVLGPSRGRLFRDGGLSASEFSRLQLGKNFKPLTLDEMRKKEPLAFARAEL